MLAILKTSMFVFIYYVHDILIILCIRGFAKKRKFQKSEITMEVGGWIQVSL